jgi:hypothetical protein
MIYNNFSLLTFFRILTSNRVLLWPRTYETLFITVASFHVPPDSSFEFWFDNASWPEPRKLSQYSVWLRAGQSWFDPRQGQRIFLLAPASRPALGPTQPPIQWVPGVLSAGVKRGRGVTLTTHPHLVPRLIMSRSYTSSPPILIHGM